MYAEQSLETTPEVKYDVVIYFEGDEAKRAYNPMIRERIPSCIKFSILFQFLYCALFHYRRLTSFCFNI